MTLTVKRAGRVGHRIFCAEVLAYSVGGPIIDCHRGVETRCPKNVKGSWHSPLRVLIHIVGSVLLVTKVYAPFVAAGAGEFRVPRAIFTVFELLPGYDDAVAPVSLSESHRLSSSSV